MHKELTTVAILGSTTEFGQIAHSVVKCNQEEYLLTKMYANLTSERNESLLVAQMSTLAPRRVFIDSRDLSAAKWIHVEFNDKTTVYHGDKGLSNIKDTEIILSNVSSKDDLDRIYDIMNDVKAVGIHLEQLSGKEEDRIAQAIFEGNAKIEFLENDENEILTFLKKYR